MTIDTPRPVLFLDVDGVISLFGFASSQEDMPGTLHWVDGIAHCIPDELGARLERLAERFELVWSTGWEEKANEYLPFILNLSFKELPVLTFGGRAVFGSSHWKLEAMDEYAGSRPAAWIDDNIDDECEQWAKRREAPTLLVRTKPATGMTDRHVQKLLRWAAEVTNGADAGGEPAGGPDEKGEPAGGPDEKGEPAGGPDAEGGPTDGAIPPDPAETGAGRRFPLPWRRARR